MGLDIHSKSRHEYHASYAGLHLIRHMAYRYCGGTKEFADWTKQYREDFHDWYSILAHYQFPNLMFHSDCEGTYTRTGQVNIRKGSPLLTGNSVGLLRELSRLRRFAAKMDREGDGRTDTYRMLLRLVRDVVNNHDGRLVFA